MHLGLELIKDAYHAKKLNKQSNQPVKKIA